MTWDLRRHGRGAIIRGSRWTHSSARLERLPHMQEVPGSSPGASTKFLNIRADRSTEIFAVTVYGPLRKRVLENENPPARRIAHVHLIAIIRRGAMRTLGRLDGGENRRCAFAGNSNYRHRRALLARHIGVREMRIVSNDVHSRSGCGASQLRSCVQV